MPKFASLFIKLNSLSDHLLRILPRIVLNAELVTDKIGMHLKKHFKFRHFISISISKNADRDKNE